MKESSGSEFELLHKYDTWIRCLQFTLPCRASTYIHVLCSCTLRFRDVIHELCLPFSVAFNPDDEFAAFE